MQNSFHGDPMNPFLPNVRNAVRAVVFCKDKVLLLKKQYETEVRYALPGGGQQVGEILEESLQRECKEEIGCEVRVKGLAYVADFFKDRDSEPPTQRHLVEFFFVCEVPVDYQPHNGSKPDKHQVDVVWANVDELKKIAAFPDNIKLPFEALASGIYQGLLNQKSG